MSETLAGKVIWAERGDGAAVADYLAAIIGQPGFHRIAVPGGSTPRPIFEDLAKRPLPWDRLELTLTDDRQVPADHPASNQRLLEEIFGTTDAQTPALESGAVAKRFDCVWIGMGGDGHIASLFPQMEAEKAQGPAVIHTSPIPLPNNAPFARLSLNFDALTNTQAIMLVIRGEEKKRVIDAAIAGETNLPIGQLLARATCPIEIFWE